jgi:hypothetical protein
MSGFCVAGEDGVPLHRNLGLMSFGPKSRAEAHDRES